LSTERDRVANDYLREAYYLYLRWGAGLKVKQLQDRLPHLESRGGHPMARSASLSSGIQHMSSGSGGSLSGGSLSGGSGSISGGIQVSSPAMLSIDSLSQSSNSSSSSCVSPGATTLVAGGDYLDLMTVLKNSQALLSEVDGDKLLGKLMSGVMENTGADRCMLLLKRKDRFLVEASACFVAVDGAQQLKIDTSLGANVKEVALPRSVINYVMTKHDTIQLDEVPKTAPWADDPYIASAQPRSLLCAPIVHMGQLLGALYLENSSMTSVFNKSRFWLISIICSQVDTYNTTTQHSA
jgi:hypothetical protein